MTKCAACKVALTKSKHSQRGPATDAVSYSLVNLRSRPGKKKVWSCRSCNESGAFGRWLEALPPEAVE